MMSARCAKCRGGEHLLITKGEAESVLDLCRTVIVDGAPQPFDDSQRAQATEPSRG